MLGQIEIIGHCETILTHLTKLTIKDFKGKYRHLFITDYQLKVKENLSFPLWDIVTF